MTSLICSRCRKIFGPLVCVCLFSSPFCSLFFHRQVIRADTILPIRLPTGPWANGQPFNNGWKPNNLFFDPKEGLSLKLERKHFEDPGSKTGAGTSYDFTSGEVRSKDFYGYGTYSVCMRPAKVSGTSASFYIHNGPYDTPEDAGRNYNDHNEIDVEFIGKVCCVIPCTTLCSCAYG